MKTAVNVVYGIGRDNKSRVYVVQSYYLSAIANGSSFTMTSCPQYAYKFSFIHIEMRSHCFRSWAAYKWMGKKKNHWWTHPLSVFDFGDDNDLVAPAPVDPPVDVDGVDVSATEGVVIVLVVAILASVLGLAEPFTAGVAPGVDDVAAFDVLVLVFGEGTSGSLGKLSVYNTLALLLHRPTNVNCGTKIKEQKEKPITSSQHPRKYKISKTESVPLRYNFGKNKHFLSNKVVLQSPSLQTTWQVHTPPCNTLLQAC